MLHLLLQHETAVRAVPELAPVCERNRWVEEKSFLLVPYHMIGARSMEAAILGQYVAHVRKHHPEAPLPGVYLAEGIFENAVQFRESLGDEKFFAKLNAAGSPDGATGGGWGKLEGWTAERFESALQAAPGSSERSRLVGRLVETVLPAYRGVAQGKDEAYVDLDEGLAVISEHAKSLGYDGLVLFLDELILWLATHSADLHFVQTEGNKLAKLVESQQADRPVPIISFVARQRDLRDLIGENVTGVESLNFSDVLSHWGGAVPHDHAGGPEPPGHRPEAGAQTEGRRRPGGTGAGLRADRRGAAGDPGGAADPGRPTGRCSSRSTRSARP